MAAAAAQAQETGDTNGDVVPAPQETGCVFNETHCACRPNSDQGSVGVCFRHMSGPQANALCSVDSCNSQGGYTCDCFGTSMCALETCGAWKLLDDSAAEPAIGSTDIGCQYAEKHSCTKYIRSLEYKMVQIGRKLEDRLFN